MKFLLIDDSPSDRERILRVLEEEFRGSEFVEVTRPGDLDEAIARGGFDLVLTEYRKGERRTGLGLSMVFGVMQRHEGHIEIESALGKGATTRLIFPVTVAGSGSRLRLEKEEKPTGLPLRVLR